MANYRRKPLRTLERVPFTALSNDDILELLNDHIDELRDAGVTKGRRERVRKDFAHNVIAVYAELRKQAFRTESGQGYTGFTRLGQALYEDVRPGKTGTTDARRKRTSMERWRRALEVIGVARFEAVIDDDGALRGLRFKLLEPVGCGSSARSSAG